MRVVGAAWRDDKLYRAQMSRGVIAQPAPKDFHHDDTFGDFTPLTTTVAAQRDPT
jgi:hypothetical protein